MSLSRRLTLSFGALLLLFAVHIGVSFWSDGHRKESFERLQTALTRQILVLEIEHALSRCRQDADSVVALAGDESSPFADADFQVMNERLAALEGEIGRLLGLAKDAGPEEAERLLVTFKQLRAAWAELYQSAARGLPLPDASTAEELSRESSAQLTKLATNERERVGIARSVFQDNENLTQRTSLLSFLLSGALAVGVAISFSVDLNRRLGLLAQGARQIGEGDYHHQIPISRKDELGTLAGAFNEMAMRLREALAREGEARQAAEKANQAKSAFLANMSHELRTPLNAILGYTEMLVEEAEDLGQQHFLPDLLRIKSAGTHLLALINEVLDLSKIEAGKMTLLVEPIDVAELADEVLATVSPLVQKNQNRLKSEIEGHPGLLHADATKLRQALFNLLSNASKFTSEGEITLRVREDSARKLFHFEVADTGIGMTEEQLGRIFDEFTQAELTTAKKYGGTGLGLAISRKFCRLMGGELSATSRAGQGSTFHIVLPAIVDPSPEAVTSASTPPA